MVQLSLTPLKGNHTSQRGWPFNGYFALTQVSTHGILRTCLVDDQTPLMTSKITIAIRCYESRVPRLGVVHTNVLYTKSQTLWQPPEGVKYAPIANLNIPFRLSLPPDVQAPSMCHMQEYRVFWRLEAVIAHVPLVGQGTRLARAFDLHFIRHDTPPPLYLSPSTSSSSTVTITPSGTTTTSRITEHLPSNNCSYTLSLPNYPIGPEDSVPISISVRPENPGATVTRLYIAIDRRVSFKDPKHTNNVLPFPSDQHQHQKPVATPLPPTPPSTAPGTSSEVDREDQEPKEALDAYVSSEIPAALVAGSDSSSPHDNNNSASPSPASARLQVNDSNTSDPRVAGPSAVRSATSFFTPGNPQHRSSVETLLPTPPEESSGFAFASILKSNIGTSAKIVTQTFVSTERTKGEIDVSELKFAGDIAGMAYSSDVALTLPAAKPGHWSMGQTMRTSLVSIKFYVSVKVTLSNVPKNTPPPTSAGTSGPSVSSTTESFYIPPRELVVVGLSGERRLYLHNKLDELMKVQPGSIKRPRSARAELPETHPYSQSQKRPHSSSSATILAPQAAEGSSTAALEEPRKRRQRHKSPNALAILPTPPISPGHMLTDDSAPLLARPSTAPSPTTRRDASEGNSSGMDTSTDDDVVYVLTGDLEVKAIPKTTSSSSSKWKKKRSKPTAAEELPPVPPVPRMVDTGIKTSIHPAHKNDIWAQALEYHIKPQLDVASSSSKPKKAKPSNWLLGRTGEFKRAASAGAVSSEPLSAGGNVGQLTERMEGLLDRDMMMDAPESSDSELASAPSSSRAATPTPSLVTITQRDRDRAREGTPSPFMFNPPPVPFMPSVPTHNPGQKEIKAWEKELGKIENSSKKMTAKMAAGAAKVAEAAMF